MTDSPLFQDTAEIASLRAAQSSAYSRLTEITERLRTASDSIDPRNADPLGRQIAEAIATGNAEAAETARGLRSQAERDVREMSSAMPVAHRLYDEADAALARAELVPLRGLLIEATNSYTQEVESLLRARRQLVDVRKAYREAFSRADLADGMDKDNPMREESVSRLGGMAASLMAMLKSYP